MQDYVQSFVAPCLKNAGDVAWSPSSVADEVKKCAINAGYMKAGEPIPKSMQSTFSGLRVSNKANELRKAKLNTMSFLRRPA